MKRTIFIMALLGMACFEDTGDPPNDTDNTGTTTGTSSDTTADGDGGTSEPGTTSTDTDTGSSSDDETSETSESESGSEACTVESCPDGEFCVDGECQDLPPDDMLVISGGPFYRGCGETDTSCDDDEFPADPDLFVSTFAIDRNAVTTGEYAACVEADACTPASVELPLCNWGRSGYEAHPINCVSWYQAEAYCHWAGKRLPTEAEWEKSVRGTDGRLYPWGDDVPTCELAVIADNGAGCGTGETWPVGSKPAGASPYGVLDGAGNVGMWVADWFAQALEVDVDDPTGPVSGNRKVVRGSTFKNGAPYDVIRISHRWDAYPDTNSDVRGFRCAAG